MKTNFITIFIIFIFQNSFTQSDEWFNYDLDSIVSLDMPFFVYETDTIIDFKRYTQLSSSNDSSNFIAQKMYLEKKFSNREMPILPNDAKSLKRYYLDIIWAFDEVSPYRLKDYKPVKLDNIEGYEMSFVNKEDITVQRINLFLVNKNLYFFSYTNETNLKELDKNYFFNSIYFDDKFELNQYPKKPFFTIKNIVLILLSLLLISFIFRVMSKKKKSN